MSDNDIAVKAKADRNTSLVVFVSQDCREPSGLSGVKQEEQDVVFLD